MTKQKVLEGINDDHEEIKEYYKRHKRKELTSQDIDWLFMKITMYLVFKEEAVRSEN